MELHLDNQPLNAQTAVTEWQAVEFSCLPPEGGRLELSIAGSVVEPFLRPGDPAWRWRWNPQNTVGWLQVNLRAYLPDGQVEQFDQPMEVRPRKLDAERYALLLEDLERLARQVVQALGGAGAGAAVGTVGEPEAAEAIASLFGERFEPFVRAVERLGQRPPARLRAAIAQTEPGRAREFSQIDQRLLAASGQASDTLEGMVQAVAGLASLPQAASAPTYATYEYGLLVRLLSSLRQRAGELLHLPRLPRETSERLRHVRERLRELRALPALAGVPALRAFQGPSAIMQRDPDFRLVYRMWQSLRRYARIELESPLFSLPIQELPRLYECWCAVALASALLALPGSRVVRQSLTTAATGDAIHFDLATAQPLVEIEQSDGTRLLLRYQPRYEATGVRRGNSKLKTQNSKLVSLDRHTRVPDLVIERHWPDKGPALLIFDAKYRLDTSGGLPEEALADAYVYLGSIGHTLGGRVGQGAWLLYPGGGRAEHYASGVGALPLLPGEHGLATWLTHMLADIDAF